MNIDELKQKKRALGISNAKLAKLSGVPLGTINKVMSGETRQPRYDTLYALEKALNGSQVFYDRIPLERAEVRESAFEYSFPSKKQGEYTRQDFELITDEHGRYELIEGEIFCLASPSTMHQDIVGYVYNRIYNYIEAGNGDCRVFTSPIDTSLYADDTTIVMPDVLIVCDPSKVTFKGIVGAPDFVLEVVSPSEEKRDYVKKLSQYEKAGVREYWIIDPSKGHVVVYDFQDDGVPEIHPIDGELGLGIYKDDLKIDLDRIRRIIVNATAVTLTD